MKYRFAIILSAALLACVSSALAEDGYKLWLRNAALDEQSSRSLSPQIQHVYCVNDPSPTRALIEKELKTSLAQLLQRDIPCTDNVGDGSIVPVLKTDLAALSKLDLPYQQLGAEGYHLRSARLDGKQVVLLTANTEQGLLYGAFQLLQHIQIEKSIAQLNVTSAPKIKLRVLNHWDNLDRHSERGYAGQSIWDWWRLPDYVDQRYTDYARANASIGINGTVLNNVNSNALILTPPYLKKVAAVADTLRPWGMRVYLSARFSAPQEIGGLETSDPLDNEVQQWWNDKAKEIYTLIPDFGGFLVKANSEGQPGPQDFGRTHADGANMLAAAVAPFNGVVMWRAFVYSDVNPEDRHKQAYTEFKPLDGKFADNVLVQVKNGAIDFQPREPFHPMFGAFPKTPLMMEFQITKEYLGFATHLTYLGPMWEEVLQADTYAQGKNSSVAKVIDGSLHNYTITGIAGVSGIGTDRDWQGSDFNQANWYAYGRLAWNPQLSSKTIARDWLIQTFSDNEQFLQTASDMMMRSHEAVVDYMTPLGLAHLMGTGHHYGPAPWVSELARPEWNPVYYHRADKNGIGFDRSKGGSDAISQYSSRVAKEFSNLKNIDEKYLLWFHHVPWNHKMDSGSTLWEALIQHYDHGVAEVATMLSDWQSLKAYVDSERFQKTESFLKIQLQEAKWWRDACIAYFQSVSGLPLPNGVRKPEHDLEYYKSLDFPNSPGRG